MEPISISFVQSDLYWEKPEGNYTQLSTLIQQSGNTDLIVLPEMFSTGFSMDSTKIAEPMDGPSIQWMQELAGQKQAVICGSLIIVEDNKQYNRLIWMRPDGSFESYDKRHLFRMANEDKYFSAGQKKLIVELKGWKICPLICYDLRFPIWSRNMVTSDKQGQVNWEYDMLIYIANWPEARITAWEKLLYARAIENQAYVVAVNRIGTDGNDINYSGNSMLIDAKGDMVWKAKDHKTLVQTIEISKSDLITFRAKFPVGMDADNFKIEGLG